MAERIEALASLVNELSKLPGIGSRSASRMAYYLLDQREEDVRALAEAIWQAKKRIKICPVCQGFTDTPTCAICASEKRRSDTICVVAEPRDVAALERTHEFQGKYHVLHGVLSPGRNVGADDLRIKELLARLSDGTVTEVILATNPDVEGEATALYLARLIKPLGIKVSRIAHGIPVGGDLEYTDEVTLGQALSGRRQM